MNLRTIRRARQRTAKKARTWLEMRELPDGSTIFTPGPALRAIMRRHKLDSDMGQTMLTLVCLRGCLDEETFIDLADASDTIMAQLPVSVWRDVNQMVANLGAEDLDKLHSFAEPLLRSRPTMGSVLEAFGQ